MHSNVDACDTKTGVVRIDDVCDLGDHCARKRVGCQETAPI